MSGEVWVAGTGELGRAGPSWEDEAGERPGERQLAEPTEGPVCRCLHPVLVFVFALGGGLEGSRLAQTQAEGGGRDAGGRRGGGPEGEERGCRR